MFLAPKKSFLALFTLAPIATFTFLFLKPRPEIITFSGSTSMKDLFFQLSANVNSGFEVDIQSVGSSLGLDSVLADRADFALVSVNSESSGGESWKEKVKDLHSVEVAEESIGVLYRKPEGCTKTMEITHQNLSDIYSISYGHKKDSDLKNLLKDGEDACSVPVRPFNKESGPQLSGTAHSFVYGTGFFKETEQSELLTRISSGFGTENPVITTKESSFQSFDKFRKNGLKPGDMIFLPTSFIRRNKSLIEKLSIEIATYQGKTQSKAKNIEETDYEWKKPLKVFFKKTLAREKVEFLKDLITKGNNVITENFYKTKAITWTTVLPKQVKKN